MKYKVRVGQREHEVALIGRSAERIQFEIGGSVYDVAIEPTQTLRRTGTSAPVQSVAPRQPASPAAQSNADEVRAPMPGIVVQVLVQLGAKVTLGQPVVVVEAMKMENSIAATKAGVVAHIGVKQGQQVNGGDVLLVIE